MDTQSIGRLIVVAGLMLALNAQAFTGKVVGVADGDSDRWRSSLIQGPAGPCFVYSSNTHWSQIPPPIIHAV